jgi:hypothetical protein
MGGAALPAPPALWWGGGREAARCSHHLHPGNFAGVIPYRLMAEELLGQWPDRPWVARPVGTVGAVGTVGTAKNTKNVKVEKGRRNSDSTINK